MTAESSDLFAEIEAYLATGTRRMAFENAMARNQRVKELQDAILPLVEGPEDLLRLAEIIRAELTKLA